MLSLKNTPKQLEFQPSRLLWKTAIQLLPTWSIGSLLKCHHWFLLHYFTAISPEHFNVPAFIMCQAQIRILPPLTTIFVKLFVSLGFPFILILRFLPFCFSLSILECLHSSLLAWLPRDSIRFSPFHLMNPWPHELCSINSFLHCLLLTPN